MKKRSIYFCLVLFLIFTVCSGMVSCDIFKNNNDESDSGENVYATNLTKVQESQFIASSNPYREVDSFALDNGMNYYIYELGIIDYVPLNIEGSDGVYFDGKALELEFNYKQTNKELSSKYLSSTISNSVEFKTTSTTGGSLSAPVLEFLEAGIEIGIENSVTSTISTSFTQSYYTSVLNETTYEKNVKYKMSKDEPTGYYFYTPIASVRVYEIIVYNTLEEKIEHAFSYSQVGQSLPGLYYSKTSFLDLSSLDISFDESNIGKFSTPSKTIETDVFVTVDASGGKSDKGKIDAKLGEPYGELPTAERQGYNFKGWTCDGRKIDKDSLVISDKPIVAEWDIITEVNISLNTTFEVSSLHKVNPFAHFVDGYNGSATSDVVNLADYVDFEQLKREGYVMKITFVSDAKCDWLATLGGLIYNVEFISNGKTFSKLTDGIKDTDYERRTLKSEYINLANTNGIISCSVSTDNINSVYLKNIKIKFEFVKL